MVGDLSPKGRVGDSRLAFVFGRKLDSQSVGNTNCRPNTRTLSAIADQPWVKALRQFVKTYDNRFNKPYFQPDFPNKTTLVAITQNNT
ncbi:MAG: hypothetical protein LBC02_01760 [Planctomycetaceae bacterium]|jgi:hypothetical protein|nr:hypothetical protein [Planctomycetaceae bacterium]